MVDLLEELAGRHQRLTFLFFSLLEDVLAEILYFFLRKETLSDSLDWFSGFKYNEKKVNMS
jgi:hypothetical protein